MRKSLSLLSLLVFLTVNVQAFMYNSLWQQVDGKAVPVTSAPRTRATQYSVFSLRTSDLRSLLAVLPGNAAEGQVIELPRPDGTYRAFRVWQTSMMEAGLAYRYPDIKTYTGVALDNARVTAKLDMTSKGFHAMVYDGDNTLLTDPYSNEDDTYYIVHYKRDEYIPANERNVCLFKENDEYGPGGKSEVVTNTGLPALSKISNGYQSRTYRLALACSNQYAIAATGLPAPTIADALSTMTTSMNRINGVYEREFSITMVFVAKEDSIIFTSSAKDPYNTINTNPTALLYTNQKICDSIIGSANYDQGHVFTTYGGGLTAGLVCNSIDKAACETGFYTPVGDGFDIDYVAHEMGHQYGAEHPFNNGSDGSCGGGNIYAPSAYEPGSGSTIMAYAGICSPDDLQPHSDAYFHAKSLYEIYTYAMVGYGNTCAVKAVTNNKPAGSPAFSASYSIPYKTPFELTAPASIDSAADTLNTYCWEQWNLGDVGSRLVNTHIAGPIFRSFYPDTSRTRIFPRLDSILVGTYSYVSKGAGSPYEDHEGEKVPDTARFLTFKLTERAIYQGFGSFSFPDDTIHLDVVNTGAAFTVTSQDTGVIYWGHGTQQVVTWNVVNTNASPVSCDSVYIYLSADGGHTWPYLLGTYANNGSATITVPDTVSTAKGRIKVKGAGNVFFNINAKAFTVDTAANVATGVVKVYPSPASTVVYISTGGSLMDAVVYNVVGQTMYRARINGVATIHVAGWGAGVYYAKLIAVTNGHPVVRPFVVD